MRIRRRYIYRCHHVSSTIKVMASGGEAIERRGFSHLIVLIISLSLGVLHRVMDHQEGCTGTERTMTLVAMDNRTRASEGPDKATKGGLNVSQLKFLDEI
jgi:hypothetical protein